MGQSSYGLIGGVVGAYIGSFAGPTGASYGWLIGSSIGGYYAYTRQPDQRVEGPKLEDLKVQISSYGATIPYIRGAMRAPGNVIDATDLIPHTTETTQESQGKGGGGPSTITTTTTYTLSADIALCRGPILGIAKIWANKKLIYDMNAGLHANCITQMRVYPGTETQNPDPLFTALHGRVPAYRGLAHVVFEDFDVTEFGNRIPQFEFLIVTDGSVGLGAFSPLTGGQIAAVDSEMNYVWSSYQDAAGAMHVYITNWASGALITSLVIPGPPGADTEGGMCYVASEREVWIPRKIGNFNPAINNIEIFSAPGLTWIGKITDGVFWYGLCRYDPYHNRVWLATTSIGASIRVYDAHSKNFEHQTGLSISTVYGIAEILFLSDGATAAVLVETAVILLNTVSMNEIAVIPHGGHANAGYESHMAYDAGRGRLIIAGLNVGANVVEINIAAQTATLRPVSGTVTPVNCVYMPGQDRYVVFCSGGPMVQVINPYDWTIESAQTPTGYAGSISGDYVRVPGDSAYVFHGDDITFSSAYKIPVGNVIQSMNVGLDTIVQDLALLTGLTTGDLDVTALASDTVDGYLVANQMTARAAIEPLQQAFYFDAVESDDVLKFVKRGGALVGTMLEEDRAGPNGDVDAALQITRLAELELPGHLDVQYYDKNADYLIGSQYARRTTRFSKNTAGLTLAIAMSADKAAQCALVNLYTAWLRQTYTWSTSRKYAQYEPTDVIALPTQAATYYARITAKRDLTNGRIEWEALMEDSAVYSQTGVGDVGGYVPQTVNIPPITILRLLDINLLRDQDDANGFYAAATGVDPWPGAQLLKSVDNGQTYQTVTSFTAPAAIGTAQTVLGDWTGGNDFEYANSVDVLLLRGSLANTTEIDARTGVNTCVIGDEILQFTTAQLIAPDTYRLSGLLRGRRGTEWAQSLHAIGERFVLTETATGRNVWQDTADIGKSFKYRAPTFGQTLAQASVYNFSNTAARLKPYAPSHLEGWRNSSNNDLTISWNRRGRIDGQWRDSVDVPIGEVSELYDVEIYDAAFASLKRTFANATIQSQLYSSANQSTDGFTPGAPIGVKVYQRSAVVGRGYAAAGVL